MTSSTPIDVAIADVPKSGLRVCVRLGECFGHEIAWEDAKESILVPSDSCNLKGENGLVLRSVDDGWGYAGYEVETKTWWRYREEAMPGTYREHCMQVLAVL